MKFNINIGTDNCKLFANNYDLDSVKQISEIALQNKKNKVRIMPDYHGGKGCVIGTTIELTNKANPSHIGLDIGCGVSVYKLGKINIDFEAMDKFIRENIPHGANVNKNKVNVPKELEIKLDNMLKNIGVEPQRVYQSIGTLGSGNHYLEVGKSEDNILYLTVHSGSRNLGVQVAKYYQKVAEETYNRKVKEEKEDIIKNTLNKTEIQEKIVNFKTKYPYYYKEYLFDKDLDNYIRDMKITTQYAELNRFTMIKTLLKYLGIDFSKDNFFQSIHNYIDDKNVLRKGAISAHEGERVVIPINMRDGMILGLGKGNSDWNNSAPHGAGRLCSRSRAKEFIQLDEFKESMKGIFSTCVSVNTLDESPMAYKPIEDILECITETVEVIDIIKPVYNFKSN